MITNVLDRVREVLREYDREQLDSIAAFRAIDAIVAAGQELLAAPGEPSGRAFDVRDEDGKPFDDAAYVRHLERKVRSLLLMLLGQAQAADAKGGPDGAADGR